MTSNQVKKLGSCVLCLLCIAYFLLREFSYVGIIAASAATGAMFAFAFNKRMPSIVWMADLHILCTMLAVLVICHEGIAAKFGTGFLAPLAYQSGYRIGAMVVCAAVGIIGIRASQRQATEAALVVLRFGGIFLIAYGAAAFLFIGEELSLVVPTFILCASFALLALCRLHRSALSSSADKQEKQARTPAHKNAFKIVYATGILVSLLLLAFALKAFVPGFHFSSYNTSVFLNLEVLPWYTVLAVSLLIVAIIAIGIHLDKGSFDDGGMFLMGFMGLLWVVKASVFFSFAYHGIPVMLYLAVLFAFMDRFMKAGGKADIRLGARSIRFMPFKDSAPLWVLGVALATVASIWLLHDGYVFLWATLAIGVPLVLFGHNAFVSWQRDAVFWQLLLLLLAGIACTASLQNGYSMKKLILIGALFACASAFLFALNYKNKIGQNSFRRTKMAATLAFVVLVSILVLKGGASFDYIFPEGTAHRGSFVEEGGDLRVTANAQGEGNRIVALSYVWADGYFYDDADVVEAMGAEAFLAIEGHHLIVWAEDKNGVVSRSDRWFADGRIPVPHRWASEGLDIADAADDGFDDSGLPAEGQESEEASGADGTVGDPTAPDSQPEGATPEVAA
jgi:hypothetical protein